MRVQAASTHHLTRHVAGYIALDLWPPAEVLESYV
jgi:hypothetical protein